MTRGMGNRKVSWELGNQNTTFAVWNFLFHSSLFSSYKDIREQTTYICFCSKATFPFLRSLFWTLFKIAASPPHPMSASFSSIARIIISEYSVYNTWIECSLGRPLREDSVCLLVAAVPPSTCIHLPEMRTSPLGGSSSCGAQLAQAVWRDNPPDTWPPVTDDGSRE